MIEEEFPFNWSQILYGDAVEIISTNAKKIKQSEYLQAGIYPVIDQGKDHIGGYTNDSSKIITCHHPLIIFAGHRKSKQFF